MTQASWNIESQGTGHMANTAGRKSFVLGLGMAKAGTTWLFDYFRSHPQAHMGFEKEMHILHAPEYGSYAKALRHIPWRKFGGASWLRQQAIRAWYRADWNRYLDYFTSLVESENKIVTGDLCPSNQKMTVASMKRVRGGFQSRGLRVVAVFIARDPVERLLSDVRYSERLLARSRYRSATGKPYQQLFLERMANEPDEYETEPATELRMREVFDDRDRLFLLHEELFSQESIADLTAKLGIAPVAPQADRKVNAAPDMASLPAEIRRDAARRFESTYHWAAARFGSDRILRLWPNAKFVIAGAVEP